MRIRWTEPAARDFIHLCDYTRERDGGEQARKLALRIHGALGALLEFPNLGRPGRKPGTRELVFSGLPFLAIYRVREDTLELLRILHGAQRWP